jgi:hypothetical protein
MPDNGIELKNHLRAYFNNVKIDVDAIVEAKIIYVDIRTGKEVTEIPSVFKLKIKNSDLYSK